MLTLLLRILALAVLYCGAAGICQGLAPAPGAAIAFWPPAGIALGAMLFWDRRVWPGVLLGHLAFSYLFIVARLPTGSTPGMLAFLGMAACGATLQALLGATMIRWSVPARSGLEDGPTVLRFLLLAGPASCLLSATLAVPLALALGVIPDPATALREWVVWYIGDAIGVIVIAPLAQVLGARAGKEGSTGRLLRLLAAVGSAAVLTVVAFVFARRQYQESRRHEQSRAVTLMEERLRGELLGASESTHWVEALLLASEEVTRPELERFSEVVFRNSPCVCAIGIAEGAGLAPLRIVQMVPKRMHGLEEGQDLSPMIGPDRRSLLRPGVTTPFTTLAGMEGGHTLLVLPVGRGQGRVTGVERYSFAVLDHAALLETSMRDPRLAQVSGVLAIEAADGERAIHASPGTEPAAAEAALAAPDSSLPERAQVDLLDMKLTLLAMDGNSAEARGGILPWAVLAWGMTFTGLLQAFLMVVMGQRRRVETLVEERTKALNATNRELAAALEGKERAVATATQALADAQAAGAAKVRFLATISHELRTPMNAIMGLSENIRDGSPDPRAREQGATIHQAARNLLTIINDILDYSRLEAGKLELRQSEFCLADELEQIRQMFADSAASRGLGLAIEIEPGMPPTIIADLSRLRQILVNLIGNAIKFTNVGGVSVVAEAGDPQQDRFILRIRVMDTGPGIEEAKREELFKPFSQIDNSWTRRHGGSGLGLAICRQLTTLMGGQIELERGRAIGSSFLVSIPVHCDRTKSPPRSPTPSPIDIDFSSLRLLVVEDNKVNMAVALAMLSKIGVGTVLCAEDGIEAVEQWRRHSPEIILMDLQLPRMDGLAAAREIRLMEAGTGTHPRIIAFTANAMESDRQACMLAGMDDFLTKPFTRDDLARMIARNYRDLRLQEKFRKPRSPQASRLP